MTYSKSEIDINILRLVTIYVLPASATNESAPCPQGVFIGLVWFSEYLNIIEQLIFVREVCCIFFDVTTKYLHIIYVGFKWGNLRVSICVLHFSESVDFYMKETEKDHRRMYASIWYF